MSTNSTSLVNRLLAAFLALGIGLSALAQEPEPPALSAAEDAQSREDQAFAVGMQAAVYGLPVVKMYQLREEILRRGAPNQFIHLRTVAEGNLTNAVLPSLDVLYSFAWLDLSRGPIVLTIPDTKGRYFSVQTLDVFTVNDVFASLRTGAIKGTRYAYIGPNSREARLPAGMLRVDCTTPQMCLVARTYVSGTNDLQGARAVQDGFKLVPLDPAAQPAVPQRLPVDTADPLSFFEILDGMLRQNPPPALDEAVVVSFKEIGLGVAQPFKAATVDPATRAGLIRALDGSKKVIASRTTKLTGRQNGWLMPPVNTGRYGTDYLLRAVVASLRVGINAPADIELLGARQDAAGQQLTSTNRYVVRFDKSNLPPVKEFWSLTAYRSPEGTLVQPGFQRHNLTSLARGLRTGADGSVEIYLQKDSPGAEKEANWLPTPDGDFRLILRLYNPKLFQLGKDWTPPPITRLP